MSQELVPGSYFGSIPSILYTARTNPIDNHKSTFDTLAQMQAVVVQSSEHPWVLAAVADALREYAPSLTTVEDAIRAIWLWIKANVRFVEDEQILADVWGYGPDKADVLIRPERLLSMPVPAGDCDDFSMLFASMVMALRSNVRVDFVTVAADPDRPQDYSHVYTQITLPGQIEPIPMDVSHGPLPGWETEGYTLKSVWPVNASIGRI